MTLNTAGLILILGITAAADVAEATEQSPNEDQSDTEIESVDYEKDLDTSLRKQRTPIDELMQQAIGTTTRALRFDWRKSPLHAAFTAGQLLELNNFNSWRTGATFRVPLDDFLIELQTSYVYVRDSRSSNLMALTPYRQPGRPSRFELDLGLQWPMAEGVVTPRFNWLPTVDLSLSLYVGLRYLIYPGIYKFDGILRTMRQLFSTQLSAEELANLEDRRLLAMDVVPNRYISLVGFSTDVYSQFGLFLNVKTLLHVPIGSDTTIWDAWWWYELSTAVGVAF